MFKLWFKIKIVIYNIINKEFNYGFNKITTTPIQESVVSLIVEETNKIGKKCIVRPIGNFIYLDISRQYRVHLDGKLTYYIWDDNEYEVDMSNPNFIKDL